MAKIITLGCEVSVIRKRFAAIHSELFGASSYRLVVNAFTGRRCQAYAQYRANLLDLLAELEKLESRIAVCDGSDLTSRGAHQLQQTLLEYTTALMKVIGGLATICYQLNRDEQAYRAAEDARQSRFNRDKAGYDHAMMEMENIGNKLNRLFSTY